MRLIQANQDGIRQFSTEDASLANKYMKQWSMSLTIREANAVKSALMT